MPRSQTTGRLLPAALLRAPSVHFAAAGALVFLLSVVVPQGSTGEAVAPTAARDIHVDAVRIKGLQRDYFLANRVDANEAETRALVDNLVSEEILFREALARGFEQSDRAIAWRLVQKMRYLGEDPGDDVTTLYHRALAMGLHRSDPVVRRILVEKVRLIVGRTAPDPSDDELAAWYDAHKNEYQQASRVTLRHVFFDRGRRGDEGAGQAAAAAAAQAKGHGIDVARSLGGDPFVMGGRLAAQGRADLTKFFGPSFADEALATPPGAWAGPLESTYGWHLVWIEQRLDPRIPKLGEVRSRVEKSYDNASRGRHVSEFLERVRAAYTVRIDEDAIRGGRNG